MSAFHESTRERARGFANGLRMMNDPILDKLITGEGAHGSAGQHALASCPLSASIANPRALLYFLLHVAGEHSSARRENDDAQLGGT